MRPPRRRVLAGLAAAGWTGFAGCSTLGRDDDGTPTGTPTGTPPGTITDLSYTAEILEQPSTDAPGRTRAELDNRGESTVRVEARETIALRYEDGPERAVLLFPETPVGPNETPSAPADGCWRYTDDDFLVRDLAVHHEIEPGDALAETYRVYTWGEERSCLPDGEYRFDGTVRDRAGGRLELWLDVTIDGGHLAVAADERQV